MGIECLDLLKKIESTVERGVLRNQTISANDYNDEVDYQAG